MKTEDLAKALIVTAETVGHELTRSAAHVMALDLEDYDQLQIVAALKRCRRELRGRLTIAGIVERIEDGHVGADEAWATCSRGEDETIVWTDEMAEAFGIARPLLKQGDAIGARMAFRDAYARLVTSARAERRPARWVVSLGTDAGARERVLREAVERGRLNAGDVARYLPPPVGNVKRLPSGEVMPIGELVTNIRKLVKK